MARSFPYRSRSSVLLFFLYSACTPLILSCGTAGGARGVPLYPNGQTTPLPRDQIAELSGPIATIDGRDVQSLGGQFELLPGCHVVELDRRVTAESYALTAGTYWMGQFPATIYVLRTKAGARYVIRRDIILDGQTGRVVLSAREEEASGAGADLNPAASADEIKACR